MSEREVAAAAERLRRVQLYGGTDDFASVYPQGAGQFREDEKRAIRGCLATVAADEQLRQRLQANAKYFDEAAEWAKKQWNEQAASMAKEAADRFRAALNIALPSDGGET